LPSSTPAAVPALHDVEDELAWLDQARRRLAAGDAGGALTRISAYQSVFPRGHFQPEALALRAEALAARGERALAQLAAARFLATAPSHPLAARMRALVDASADPQRDRSN
jgi:outer membrane protein assembly factor BamD (BamD/ComL family)